MRYELETLRKCRVTKGITQSMLAHLAGTHVSTVKYWEARSGFAKGWALDRFAEILGVDGNARKHSAEYRSAALTAPAVPSLPKPYFKTCGATNRRGVACIMRPILGKRRCKFHGGLSTGPRTHAGRLAISEAQKKRWRK